MKFYSYSPHEGMQYHPTKDLATKATDDALQAMTARGDYTIDEIASITWGEVTERAASNDAGGYVRRRQDRLSYDAAHPPEVPGRMENRQGELTRIANIKEQDLLEHELVLDIACIWKPLSERVARFKNNTFCDVNEFVNLLFEQFNVARGGTEGNMQFTTFDGRFMLKIAIQKHIGLGPELQAARKKLLDAVEMYPEEADDLKTIVQGTFFPTDGNVVVAKVLALRAYKLSNPLWNEGMDIINKAIEVVGAKKQVRLYERNELGGKYIAIPLDIAAL